MVLVLLLAASRSFAPHVFVPSFRSNAPPSAVLGEGREDACWRQGENHATCAPREPGIDAEGAVLHCPERPPGVLNLSRSKRMQAHTLRALCIRSSACGYTSNSWSSPVGSSTSSASPGSAERCSPWL